MFFRLDLYPNQASNPSKLGSAICSVFSIYNFRSNTHAPTLQAMLAMTEHDCCDEDHDDATEVRVVQSKKKKKSMKKPMSKPKNSNAACIYCGNLSIKPSHIEYSVILKTRYKTMRGPLWVTLVNKPM